MESVDDGIQVKSDDVLEVSLLNSSAAGQLSHLALDIGGSLIKMVYLSRSSNSSEDQKRPLKEKCGGSNGCKDLHLLNGRLQFMKFETSKINECLEFISSMQLHGNGEWHHEDPLTDKNIIKADHSEAFTYTGGQRHCLQIDHKDLYPFLLVIIGTGVSMCKVEGPGKFNLLGGTSIGGGTFLGLGRLLTKCKSFDELVELSHQGNNSVVDIRLQDILGEMDYSCAGVVCPSTTIVSHFGKQVSDNKELEEYRPEDVAASLLRMISFNIGQLAQSSASRFGLKKMFFGGSFLQHDYTVDSISKEVANRSGGASKAMFFRHDGFLGALGAFMSYQNLGLDDLMTHQLVEEPRNAHLK